MGRYSISNTFYVYSLSFRLSVQYGPLNVLHVLDTVLLCPFDTTLRHIGRVSRHFFQLFVKVTTTPFLQSGFVYSVSVTLVFILNYFYWFCVGFHLYLRFFLVDLNRGALSDVSLFCLWLHCFSYGCLYGLLWSCYGYF